ncbi:unknown protein [Desulfotalea psychrophila LSv54]|uniref:Uncharacterized protein n=1 Tax=Desulfotalea psychrophila (strain LSv54 / DSM 12343) TaxID=177439 RepID=Q6AR79_DESPS|nr:unknown protein [Desulfotalea psychrophila LSv54]
MVLAPFGSGLSPFFASKQKKGRLCGLDDRSNGIGRPEGLPHSHPKATMRRIQYTRKGHKKTTNSGGMYPPFASERPNSAAGFCQQRKQHKLDRGCVASYFAWSNVRWIFLDRMFVLIKGILRHSSYNKIVNLHRVC